MPPLPTMKQKPDIWYWLKVLVVVLAWAYVIYSLSVAPDVSNVFAVLKNIGLFDYLLLFIVVLLIPVNWGFEAIKWKILLRPLHTRSLSHCFADVLRGITAGMATPNRLGEFAGRIVNLPAEKRAEAGVLSLTGSFSQLFVTLLVGAFAFVGLMIYIPSGQSTFSVSDYTILSVSVVLMGILLWLFTHTQKLSKWVNKIPFVKNTQKVSGGIENLSGPVGLSVMLLSLARYAVFLHQYYFLLMIFRVDVSYPEAVLAIGAIYLLMAIIPVVAAGEPGVRGSVSMLVFGLFVAQPATVFSVSLLLWLLNVAIPAIIGSAMMLLRNRNNVPFTP